MLGKGRSKLRHNNTGTICDLSSTFTRYRDLYFCVFCFLPLTLRSPKDYCTAEPFFPYDSGIRVQKVCGTYRVWEKIPTGSSWKSQFGGSMLSEIECTPMFKLWADECAKTFGGLDVCAVDALKKKNADGSFSYVIIELNGTACGFQHDSWLEDSTRLATELHKRLGTLLQNRKGRRLLQGLQSMSPRDVEDARSQAKQTEQVANNNNEK